MVEHNYKQLSVHYYYRSCQLFCIEALTQQEHFQCERSVLAVAGTAFCSSACGVKQALFGASAQGCFFIFAFFLQQVCCSATLGKLIKNSQNTPRYQPQSTVMAEEVI